MIGAYTFRLVCRPFQVGLLAIMFTDVVGYTALTAKAAPAPETKAAAPVALASVAVAKPVRTAAKAPAAAQSAVG